MPQQPEVLVRDLERASDEAENALVRALVVYSAVAGEGDDEEEDDSLLAFFLRSAIPGFVAAVIALTERYAGTSISEPDHDRIVAEAVVVARAALRDAVRADVAMLSGDGDISRVERLRRIAGSVITSVRSEVQQSSAELFGFATKTWRTRRDLRVRGSHQRIEGVTVGAGERFETTGYTIAFPGDRSAPPQGWLNCRCSLQWGSS